MYTKGERAGQVSFLFELSVPVKLLGLRWLCLHAHNKHSNHGRHFTSTKYLIHNAGLKITISMEMEEG